MAVTVGSNLASLGAQRALAVNSNGLGRAFERLSSGLRINRASDDAAGLAVSDRLRADARLFGTAARNINDGFSLINISNGAFEQQSAILIRLGELAEQSANGSYSNAQRASLDIEYRQLLKEFGRIGDSTTFNGLNLLQGERLTGIGSMHIQAGINGSSGARVTISSGDTATLSGTINLDALASANWDGLGGIDIGDLFAHLDTISNPSLSISQLRTLYRDSLYFTETVGSNGQKVEVALGLINGSFFYHTGVVSVDAYYRIAGTDNWAPATSDNTNNFLSGTFTIDPQTGRIVGNTVYTGSLNGNSVSVDFAGLTFLSQGTGVPNGSAIDFTGVDTIQRARAALGVINNRLSDLSQIRGRYGAFESRLQSALRLVTTAQETSLAARSRIVDADIAAESADLLRRSILQQAGASVLAQANVQPQLALTLLAT